MFSFSSESPLPVSGAESYRGMAFDGCRFYLAVQSECTVAVLDRDLCLLERLKTCRPYAALCYDPGRNCFWAASGQCWSTLFRLDRRFREISRFELRGADCRPKALTGLSFCCESGRLAVVSGNRLLDVDPESGETRLLCQPPGDSLILAAVCLPPYFIFSALRGCAAYFVLASRDGEILAEEEAPEALAVNALALDPCTCELLLLTSRHLLRARLEEELVGGLCPCNRELCRKCEENCHCGPPCACGDLLESIALVEAAVAHLLNAEGEKLEKAIEDGTPPCELLKINESVQRTLLYAIQLEQVLLSKLEAVQTLCCFCGADDCQSGKRCADCTQESPLEQQKGDGC